MASDPRSDLASAMYPSLSREAKQREEQTARDRAWRERDSQRLAQIIRETRESLRADKLRRR
jgi:hypothetical protein